MNTLIYTGIFLLIIGGLIIASVLISARVTSRRRTQLLGSDDPVIPVNLASVNDAVLVANLGGQITFINEIAQQWFSLNGEDPDLWLLSQKVMPTNAFLELFAAEGQADFSIADRRVLATSHRVTTGDSAQFIVVIREETPLPVLDREERGSGRALQVLSEIIQAITSSLELQPTLQAILDGIQRLIDHDAAQICLWDTTNEVLRPVVRSGPPAYVASTHNEDQVCRRDEGYAGWVARKRRPLLITNTLTQTEPSPIHRPNAPQTASYLAVPLNVRNRFIGTLELHANLSDGFDPTDQAVLELLAEQAAIAIENARQYSSQAERVEELSGLQKIAGAISALQNPYQLYSQLGQRVAEQMGTEVGGVLLYDRDHEYLAAQRPVHGMVDALTTRLIFPLEKGLPTRAMWDDVNYWFSNDLQNDHLISDLSLSDVVEMGGLDTLAMAVMRVGDERIGSLLVSNKANGTPFTMEDIRLLQIYADQAAILVESARLYDEEQRRVAELQGLQQITQTMSAFKNPEELYDQLTQRIAELVGVEVCGILLYEQEEEMLAARQPFYGVDSHIAQKYALSVSRRGLAREMWREHELFVSNNVFTDDNIDILGIRHVTQAAGLQTLLYAPLSAGGRRFGLLQVSNKLDGSDFNEDDKRLVAIFAGQAATLIDNARLYQDTDATLRKRAAELRSVSRVSRELNATLELERILEVISVEARRAEGATWGNLIMFVWAQEDNLQPTMFFGSEMSENGDLLIKAAARSKETVFIDDFEKVAHYPTPIEGARSALIVPILFEDQVVGVIGLYSDKPRGLGSSAAEFAQALSSQATIAVTNATRHQEQLERSDLLHRRADQMTQIFELGRSFRGDQSVEGNLSSVGKAIAESAGFTTALFAVLDHDGEHLHYQAATGMPDLETRRLREIHLNWGDIRQFLIERYQVGTSYFVPHQESANLIYALSLPRRLSDAAGNEVRPDRWYFGDLLLVPLRSSTDEPLGLMIVDRPRDGMRPASDSIELLQIFSNQAAMIIENTHLYKSVEERATELTSSLEDLSQSYEELDRLSREMITKDVELSQANELLSVRTQRLLALHRIMESVDTSREPEKVLQDIVGSVVTEMDVDQCFIALEPPGGNQPLRMIATAGRLPDTFRPGFEVPPTGGTPHTLVLTQAHQNRRSLIYARGEEKGTPAAELSRHTGAHTYIIQPIQLGADRGILLAGSTRSGAAFGEDDLDIFALLASQIVVEYENARLYQAVQSEAATAAADRDRLQQLHLITTALQQTSNLEDRLSVIARGIASVGWGKVAISLLDRRRTDFSLVTAGYTEEEEATLSDQLLPGSVWEHRFEDAEFTALQQSSCYFLPFDHPWVRDNVPGAAEFEAVNAWDNDRWHPQDQIYLPMYAGNDIIGVIHLRDPDTDERPTDESLRPIELFVQQAASALDNTRLYQETLELQSYTDAVVQSIQQGIVVTDARGIVETINSFASNQYGWSDEMIGTSLFDAQPILRTLGFEEALATLLRDGQPIERSSVQYPGEGDSKQTNITIYPRYDEQQAITGMVMLIEDITQRAQLEANIAQRGQQLTALNEVSRSISSSLSRSVVISNAMAQTAQVLPFDHLEIWLRRQDTDVVELAGARSSRDGDEEFLELMIPVVAVPQFKQIASTNMPLQIDDRPLEETGPDREADEDHLRTWLGVPMVSGGVMVGIMVFERTEADAYDAADVQIAAAYANQVAVAYQNASLFEEAEKRADELRSRSDRLALLNRVSSTLGTSLDRDSILQSALDELRQALNASQGGVIILDGEPALGTLTIQSPSNPDGSVPPFIITTEDNAAIEQLMHTKKPLSIVNVAEDPLVDTMREALQGRSIQSTLLIPLIVGNAMIGLITIDETEDLRSFTQEQIELAQTLTNQAAIAVQNARLYQETVVRQRELSILFEAGQIAAASLSLETVASNAAEYFAQSLNSAGCTISLLEKRGERLHVLAEYAREDNQYTPDEDAFDLSTESYSPSKQAVRTLETQHLEITHGRKPRRQSQWLADHRLTAVLAIPLTTHDKPLGVIELWHTREAYTFTERDIRLASALAHSMSTAIENASLHDETERRLDDLVAINELSRALTQIISLEDLHQLLTEQLEKLIDVSSLTIAQIDPETSELVFPLAIRNGQAVNLAPMKSGRDLYSYAIYQQEPLLLDGDISEKLANLQVTHLTPGLQSFLSVPLTSGEMTGLLALEDYERVNAFDESNLRVLSPIAAQIAVSIENARLYSELEQRLSETTMLQEVSRVVNSALNLQEIFDHIVGELATAFDYPLIGLFTVENGEMVLQAHHGYPEDAAEYFARISVSKGITGRAVTTGEAQFIRDVSSDPDYIPLEDNIASEIAVPIITEDTILGVINIAAGPDKPVGRSDLSLLQTFAGQVATAVTNARLYAQMVALSEELEQRVEERTRELREERDRIDTLYRIAVELTSSLDLDVVLNRALELVGAAVGADTGALFLSDPQSDMLIYRASMLYDESIPPGGRRIELKRTEGVAGWVMEHQQSLVIDNVQIDPRWENVPGTETRRSLLGAPLIATGDVLGCIFFNSDTVAAFDEEHLTLVEAAAKQVANAINNAELYRLIRDQAERLGIMLRSQQTEAAKSQAILESVADGVMVADQSGEIILFNAAAEQNLGLRRDQVLGRPANELTGLYGTHAQEWTGTFDLWQADPRAYEGQYLSEQVEIENRVLQVHVSPVLHGAEYLGLVFVFRDITREVMAERAKSEFVARVSHELRTPMTSIKGYADLLLLGAAGEITPEQRRFLETVKSNADRLSLLVNDLLDISRIEQGQIELDIRPFDLRELFDEILKAFDGRKQSDERTIPIIIEAADEGPEIHGDYDRITQIFTNLVSNAYQYTPDEGQITIRIKQEFEGVQVDIIDTGVGIPEEAQARVFERFFRGENQPLVFKHSGTGLGLAIVQQVAEMHQGRVWFESTEGEGSTFSVWLPYVAQEMNPAS